jgi:hypothetical protein
VLAHKSKFHERLLFVFFFIFSVFLSLSVILKFIFIYVSKTDSIYSDNDLKSKRDEKNCYLVIIKYLKANGQAEQLFNLYTHFSLNSFSFFFGKPIFIYIFSLVARHGFDERKSEELAS